MAGTVLGAGQSVAQLKGVPHPAGKADKKAGHLDSVGVKSEEHGVWWT